MKIWICGSVAQFGEEENIRELVKTFKYFSGAFFNVNYNDVNLVNTIVAANETFHLLNLHKGEGKVVWTPWAGRHDWAMNAFLNMVPNGDAFIYIDAQELIKTEFLEQMPALLEKCRKDGIESVWWNRPYIMLNKRPEMQFAGNPHAWLQGIRGKYINIADEKTVSRDDGGTHFGRFLYNKKKRENTMLLHGIKYSLYDLPNNQFSMFYMGAELVEHERRRQAFCACLDNLSYSRDLEGLENFFREKWNYLRVDLIEYLNFEFVFLDFVRYKILGHSIDQIMSDRYTYRVSKEEIVAKLG